MVQCLILVSTRERKDGEEESSIRDPSKMKDKGRCEIKKGDK